MYKRRVTFKYNPNKCFNYSIRKSFINALEQSGIELNISM